MTDAVQRLERELREIFGQRLLSLATYGPPPAPGKTTHTMAIVERLGKDDLDACAAKVSVWHEREIATPLLLAAHEFDDSLDAFPLEFGAIIADHRLIAGDNPFGQLKVDPADVRRACEIQARSHLLHLREGFVETGGDAGRIAALIVQSAAPFAALLRSIERLAGGARQLSTGVAADVVRLATVREMAATDARRIFPDYLRAIEDIVSYVNAWGRG